MSGDGPAIYTDEYYRRIQAHESSYWWHAGVREVAGRLLRRYVRIPPATALDVGCGTGGVLRWLREVFPAARSCGVDLAPRAVALSRQAGHRDTLVASALALPFSHHSFDLVISHDVLQHLPLPDGDRAALAETCRVLRPGGHLLLRTNAASGSTLSDHEASFRIYHPADLARRIEDAGLAILALSRINLVGSLVERVRRWSDGARGEGEGAARGGVGSYRGLPLGAQVRTSRLDPLKRALLALEGRWIEHGGSLPYGHSLVCLARRL